MEKMKCIYILKNDYKKIKMIQDASLDNKNYYGYKIENGLLFGTEKWFNSIENGLIQKFIVKGIITNIYMSGLNDYPEFEIENDEGKTIWTREGNDIEYKIGKSIELVYVKQKYKRPINMIGVISKCVIEIKTDS